MKFTNEKRKDRKILSTWSLDGKIFIITSPSGRPKQMFSIEEIKELWRFCLFVYFVFLPSCYRLTPWLSLEKRKLIAQLYVFLHRAASAGGAYVSSFFMCSYFMLILVSSKMFVFPCFSFLPLPWCKIVFCYMQIQNLFLLVWTKTKLMEAQTLTHTCLFVV